MIPRANPDHPIPRTRTQRHAVKGAAAILSACVLALSACGSGSGGSNSGSAGQTTTVKIETAPGNVLAYPAYFADKLGYFKDNGIKATFARLTTGQQASAALISGALDIVYFDPYSAAPILDQGVAIQAVLGEEINTWDLMVNKKFAGQQLQQIAAQLKTVGAPSIGGAGAKHWTLIANQYHLPANSYKMVADSGGVGFLSGNEDGVIVAPTASCLLKTKGAVAAFSYYHPTEPASSYPDLLAKSIKIPANLYWASKKWIDANPQTVTGVQKALTKAEAWMDDQANLDKMASMIRSSDLNPASLSDSELHDCLGTVQGLFQPYFSAKDAATWSDILIADGTTTKPMPDAKQWLHPAIPTGPAS